MSLPDVATARATMLAQVTPLGGEAVPLSRADGRWLSAVVVASRHQPPFDASAMDGWAVRTEDVTHGARLIIVGESAAGNAATLEVGPGQAARIFTGAPLPDGANGIVIQERADRDGDVVVLGGEPPDPDHVRPRGGDFQSGDVLLGVGMRLNPWRIALAASAGTGSLMCGRTPQVAILPHGDELVRAGDPISPHQIYDSAGPALAAFVGRQGGVAKALDPVGDDDGAIRAQAAGALFDLLVVVGGASVGDHDRVKPALKHAGATLFVEGCAVRPGKPVWFARLADGRPVLGLPGNPASALVCAELFLAPLLARLQGGAVEDAGETAVLEGSVGANGPRDHYLRARVTPGADGTVRAEAFSDQDSSLVSVLAQANGLIRRAPHAQPSAHGDVVEIRRPA